MSNSFNTIYNLINSTGLINPNITNENQGYITDNILNDSGDTSFTEAKITLNPKIFNNLDSHSEITAESLIIAKNKVIDTLTETNKKLVKTITDFNNDISNTNQYIEDLSKKINNKTLIELETLLKQEQFDHERLKIGYDHLTKEYVTLKKTYNGLNRVYIDNVLNYFNLDDIKTIETLKKENADFKKSFLCGICFTNTINIILNPCGHVTICKDCIENMIQHSNESVKCPLCNHNIEMYNDIFLPI